MKFTIVDARQEASLIKKDLSSLSKRLYKARRPLIAQTQHLSQRLNRIERDIEKLEKRERKKT
jgi:hypothetical protein